ncbi:MAG: hypothetical protein ACI89D_000682 [Bermanella sp.]|jgi:hypothetical protein
MPEKQSGQSMVEYIIVVAALVTALLMTPVKNGEHANAIEWLMSSIENNYQGYSKSVSGVHYYEPERED